MIQLTVSLYNSSVHSSTGYTPNEVLFNQNNIANRADIDQNAQEIFTRVRKNLDKAKARQEKQNKNKEEPPKSEEKQEVYVKPNIRKKLEPRARKTVTQKVTDRTFENSKNIKRHKNKVKRLK